MLKNSDTYDVGCALLETYLLLILLDAIKGKLLK